MVFVSLCVINFFIVWRFYPETKGLSLEEIDELFGDPVAVHLTDANKEQMGELEKQIREFTVPSGSGSGGGRSTPEDLVPRQETDNLVL